MADKETGHENEMSFESALENFAKDFQVTETEK